MYVSLFIWIDFGRDINGKEVETGADMLWFWLIRIQDNRVGKL